MTKPRLFKVVGQLVGVANEGRYNPNATLIPNPIGSLLLFVGFIQQAGCEATGVLFLTETGIQRLSYSYAATDSIFEEWKDSLREINL